MAGLSEQGPDGGKQGSAREKRRDERKGPLPLMTLTALGVVFGDLGTSPLYTMQTILQVTGAHPDRASSLGVLSLIFWTLIIVVSIKYCAFVMQADNKGEGGILALMSLVGVRDWKKGAFLGAVMGLLGAALIYGDGVITPAISVLSAIEGVNVATSALKPYVLPVGMGILFGLFAVQRFGTAKIGSAFGPVMLVWFLTLAALGIAGLVRHPEVLAAINPAYGVELLIRSRLAALLVLGGVFLCCTGGEALYADMGHVGRLPIRLSWYAIVVPALLLNYAGQTGVLLEGHAGQGNPFFTLAPSWGLYPLVVLATAATVIASQSIISGVFSMTRQAAQLGWLPQFQIEQTSRHAYGQIYIPLVNGLMMVVTLAIMLAFRSSDRLAGAYGMAVSTTMMMTTGLLFWAMTRVWKWPPLAAAPVFVLFMAVDVSFFVANLTKIVDGGWVPLSLGAVIFTIMLTWRQGVQAVGAQVREEAREVEPFLAELADGQVARTPGVAAFLTRLSDRVPPLVSRYIAMTGALHETVVALSLEFTETPRVAPSRRASFEKLADGFWRISLRFGFMEEPDLGKSIADLKDFGEKVDMSCAQFFGTRDFVTRSEDKPKMSRWRTALFAYLYRNGMRMPDRFGLPPERTVEIAREIGI